jgi:hypothetical protein
MKTLPDLGTLLMGLTGMTMIVWHNQWIRSLASKLENQKHRNLALYRLK